MYIIKLKITKEGGLPEVLFEESILDEYLNALFRNKQIVNFEMQYEPLEEGVQLNLFCPELDAYQDKNSNVYALRSKKKLTTELGLQLDY